VDTSSHGLHIDCFHLAVRYDLNNLGSASYHDFHHTHNVGNYSSFFQIWDTIFGTNKSYFKYLEKVKESRRKNNEEIKMRLTEAKEKLQKIKDD
jgi:sterol desaturase/sphingolipid hydroxylase (fatty acid hydroxylase superfamily)